MLDHSGLPKFLWVEAFSTATHGMPTAERRRKHSKDGCRTSIRGTYMVISRTLLPSHIWRAIELKEHLENLNNQLRMSLFSFGISTNEVVTDLGPKKGESKMVFFVDGLPPLDAG